MKRLLFAAAGLALLSAPALAQSYGAYPSDNNPNVPSNSVNAYDRYDDSYARDRAQYERDRADYYRARDAYYRDRDGDDYAYYDPRYDRDTLRHSPAYPLAPSDWDGSNGGRPRNISRDGFNRDY